MKAFRRLPLNGSRANGLGLALLLLLAVLSPSICLLWFMNRAAQNERLAVRQRLADAYRAHLVLTQERLDTYWGQTAADLRQEAERRAAPALFAKLVRERRVDSAILFDAAGKLAYPNVNARTGPAPVSAEFLQAADLEITAPGAAAKMFSELARGSTNTDQAAQALQAQARCLLAAGAQSAALTLLAETLPAETYRKAVDLQGRLIAPNAQLLALELLKQSAPDRSAALLSNLVQQLQDYGEPAFPASQRRFLMHELQKLFPGQTEFPTLAAEDLAARFLEAGGALFPEARGKPESSRIEFGPAPPEGALPPRAEGVLRASPLAGIWQFVSGGGRVITLHETAPLAARLSAEVPAAILPSGAELSFVAPGKEPDRAALTQLAGPRLPGWRLALLMSDSPLFEAAARQRIAAYVWIGVLVVGAVFVLVLLALGLVRRQVALTQLRNDLVANVTHELKTPLASMRLLVDTLLDSHPLEEQTTREYLELIARENLRLSRLIENFLAFSRMERNKYALDFKIVEADEIVAGACAAVRERFHASGCHFTVKVDEPLPSVAADADALVTALVNLLDNAYKYSGEEKQITLLAGTMNGSLVFKVVDNGMGMSPRETKRIFKRFYRVNSRGSGSVAGCGLGLSIVRYIVTAHHGAVSVESAPGRGSTFTVSLPVKTTQNHQEVV